MRRKTTKPDDREQSKRFINAAPDQTRSLDLIQKNCSSARPIGNGGLIWIRRFRCAMANLRHRGDDPRRRSSATAVYYAFDLLELDGEVLRWAPIEERRARLAELN